MSLNTNAENLAETARWEAEKERTRHLAPEEEGVVNIAMHPALFPAFVDWLHGRGLGISPPIALDDHEETFRIVTVPPHRLR